MKTFFAILLATGSVIAGPVIIREDGLSLRAAGCNADNVLRALRNPTASVGASAFCSAYIQPTVTKTSTASFTNTASTSVSTTTTQITATATTTQSSVVAVVTCPVSPSTPPTCAFPGYGYGTYIIPGPAIANSPEDCHEQCLANPACMSFQIDISDGSTYCTLFDVPTAGNTGSADIGAYFYDRGCPQYLPDECAAAPSITIKKRAVAVPTYLATVPASRISSACSCFITSPAATSTTVLVTSVTGTITTTATIVKTSLVASTSTLVVPYTSITYV